MSRIELTEEDLNIMYGRSAKAAFIASVATCFLRLSEHRDGEALQDLLLTTLKESLRNASAPTVPYPMPQEERVALRQYYRLFVGFYRDPNRLENLPSDVTKQ